jgi:hypothetical protein
MLNTILAFLILFTGFFIGFKLVRNTTTQEKWKLTKLVGYSALCAALSLAALIVVVVLF